MARVNLLVLLFAYFSLSADAQTPRVVRASPAQSNSPAVDLKLDAPAWLKDFRFPQTKLTFVRVQYDSGSRAEYWATDFPDADLNLAAQLGRLTKLDVSQPSRVLRLSDPAIHEYPLLYLTEPGRWTLGEAEIVPLRKYLNAGGFLVLDDFWGDAEWQHVRSVLKQVFPDREPTDLPLSHPLFHCVFDLKEKPQVPSIHAFLAGFQSERFAAREVHYRAIQDANGRIMILICHNTDLADGWERVGDDPKYTREISVARALPMGINILFFALTQPKK